MRDCSVNPFARDEQILQRTRAKRIGESKPDGATEFDQTGNPLAPARPKNPNDKSSVLNAHEEADQVFFFVELELFAEPVACKFDAAFGNVHDFGNFFGRHVHQ